MNPTTNQKIARASFLLMIVSMSGHLLGLGKEMIVAATFGIGWQMDAYYAAMTVPTIINNIIIAAFATVFVPSYVRYRMQDVQRANRIASAIINYLAVLLIFVAAVMIVFDGHLMRLLFGGFSPEALSLAGTLFIPLCLGIVMSATTGVIMGLLNAVEEFVVPALSQIFITLCTIAAVVLLRDRLGVGTLVLGLIAGLFIQLVLLVSVIRGKGYVYHGGFGGDDDELRPLLRMVGIYFLAVLASNGGVLIDRIMASHVAAGSVAALGYADKMVQVPLVIFSISIATAAFPYVSSQVAEKKYDDLKATITRSIRMSGVIFIPLTAYLIVMAHPLIQLLFQRHAFTPAATALTSKTFACYSLELFFFTVVMLLIRVLLALQEPGIILKMTIAGIAVKVGLNMIFMRLVKPEIAGIGLATSVLNVLWAATLWWYCQRRLGDFRDKVGTAIALSKTAAGSVIAGFAAYGVLSWAGTLLPGNDPGEQVARIAAASVSGLSVFLLAARVLEISEVRELDFRRWLFFGKAAQRETV
jgi:putative peptidoglycan lipid II flippase